MTRAYIDPDLRPALDAVPPLEFTTETLPGIRAAMADMFAQAQAQAPTAPAVLVLWVLSTNERSRCKQGHQIMFMQRWCCAKRPNFMQHTCPPQACCSPSKASQANAMKQLCTCVSVMSCHLPQHLDPA